MIKISHRKILFSTGFSAFVVIASSILLACSENSHIRNVTVGASDLGSLHDSHILIGKNIYVEMIICDYAGNRCGFWGSETSSPFNLLRELVISYHGKNFVVPKQYVHDLANLPTPSPLSVSGLVVDKNKYQVLVRGGDGIWSYVSTFKFKIIDNKLTFERRIVRYYGP